MRKLGGELSFELTPFTLPLLLGLKIGLELRVLIGQQATDKQQADQSTFDHTCKLLG